MTDSTKTIEELLTADQVKGILKCSAEHVRRLARSKKLKSKNISITDTRDEFRFKLSWIEEYLESDGDIEKTEDHKEIRIDNQKPKSTSKQTIRTRHMKLD